MALRHLQVGPLLTQRGFLRHLLGWQPGTSCGRLSGCRGPAPRGSAYRAVVARRSCGHSPGLLAWCPSDPPSARSTACTLASVGGLVTSRSAPRCVSSFCCSLSKVIKAARLNSPTEVSALPARPRRAPTRCLGPLYNGAAPLGPFRGVRYSPRGRQPGLSVPCCPPWASSHPSCPGLLPGPCKVVAPTPKPAAWVDKYVSNAVWHALAII